MTTTPDQRLQAVEDITSGRTTVPCVAERLGVSRQRVYQWIAQWAGRGQSDGVRDLLPARPAPKKDLEYDRQLAREAVRKVEAVKAVVVDGRTQTEVAAELGVHPQTVRYWIWQCVHMEANPRRRKLAYIKPGPGNHGGPGYYTRRPFNGR